MAREEWAHHPTRNLLRGVVVEHKEERFLLTGAAPERCHERTRLGAAPVSKKRIGLNLAAIPPMGFASLSPAVGAAVDWSDRPTRMLGSTCRLGARMLRRPVNWIGGAILGHHCRNHDEERRARRELLVANLALPWKAVR